MGFALFHGETRSHHASRDCTAGAGWVTRGSRDATPWLRRPGHANKPRLFVTKSSQFPLWRVGHGALCFPLIPAGLLSAEFSGGKNEGCRKVPFIAPAAERIKGWLGPTSTSCFAVTSPRPWRDRFSSKPGIWPPAEPGAEERRSSLISAEREKSRRPPFVAALSHSCAWPPRGRRAF